MSAFLAAARARPVRVPGARLAGPRGCCFVSPTSAGARKPRGGSRGAVALGGAARDHARAAVRRRAVAAASTWPAGRRAARRARRRPGRLLRVPDSPTCGPDGHAPRGRLAGLVIGRERRVVLTRCRRSWPPRGLRRARDGRRSARMLPDLPELRAARGPPPARPHRAVAPSRGLMGSTSSCASTSWARRSPRRSPRVARRHRGLNRVWEDPAPMPTLAELRDPHSWIARTAQRGPPRGRLGGSEGEPQSGFPPLPTKPTLTSRDGPGPLPAELATGPRNRQDPCTYCHDVATVSSLSTGLSLPPSNKVSEGVYKHVFAGYTSHVADLELISLAERDQRGYTSMATTTGTTTTNNVCWAAQHRRPEGYCDAKRPPARDAQHHPLDGRQVAIADRRSSHAYHRAEQDPRGRQGPRHRRQDHGEAGSQRRRARRSGLRRRCPGGA